MAGWSSRGIRPRSRGVPEPLRSRVLRRDRRRCRIAGPDCLGVATEVDHLRAVADGGGDDPANLRAVCEVCHRAKTAAEAQAARKRLGRRRAPAPHPALGPGADLSRLPWLAR